jgi:serine phosphatase RsbU (regulator of sigma subunit)
VAVTIADVSGHGIGPALCMSACRAYARMGFPMEFDLKAFITRLNKALCEDLPRGKFVTLAAGVLNPGDAVLQLISAGHGPLLFYSAAEDRFQNYGAQGVPLGILPGFGYAEPHALRFGPGDMLVMVTDGFTEWADAGDVDFGVQRIQDTIRAHRTKPSAAIISELYSAVRNFSGGTPQMDDLTAVVVKRN